MQAAVLNTITDLRQFKEDTARALVGQTLQWQRYQYCGGVHPLRQCPAYGKTCAGCGKLGHFKKVCHSRRSRVVNKIELETSKEYSEGEIEIVSIDSVHMNKNQLLLIVELRDMCRQQQNNISV